MTQADHAHEHVLGEPAYDIHSITDPADRGYVRFTWVESSHNSPRHHDVPWALYKQSVGKQIAELLGRSDVKLLGAYAPNAGPNLLGWIAYTPGRAVTTVHYVAVRQTLNGESMRRRKIATALLDAAQIGRRVVYTFQGVRRHRNLPPMDIALVEWLRGKGIAATMVPIQEWLK